MTMMSVLFGAVVGLSLGLTGGGGAIFAVPLLVYGLSVDPRQAVGISLAAVGATSAIGMVGRWKLGQVELRTGLLFAGAGMVGAPLGTWLSLRIPETALLTLFAVLMLILAARMWITTSTRTSPNQIVPELAEGMVGPTCRRDAQGRLKFTSKCTALLMAVGVASGILSGLFGVGGGFVIVPALVLFSGMEIKPAIGTSLLVITLISIAGVASHLLAGRSISTETTLLFIVGGVIGMSLGIGVSHRLSGPLLQRTFATAIVMVAVFVIIRTTLHL